MKSKRYWINKVCIHLDSQHLLTSSLLNYTQCDQESRPNEKRTETLGFMASAGAGGTSL